jgi:hypothetical protein
VSAADGKGRRGAEITGRADPGVVQQISELISNEDRKQSVDRAVGVLEEMHFAASTMPSGHYLLIGCTPDRVVDHERPPVPFVLKVLYLGPHPELVVAFTSQQRANDFGIVGQPIVWDPTPVTTADGSEPVSDGTTIFREFDPSGGIGPSPPPSGVRHFLRGYLVPPSPSVIDSRVPPDGQMPSARSLVQVGEEPI